MDCAACREAISARLDDEPLGVDANLVERHLAGCAACRAHLEAAGGLQHRLRSRPAEPAPDLTGPILARIGEADAAAQHQAWQGEVRGGLALVGVVLLLLALPALVLGDDAGASVHVAHELGSFHLALAVGFLVAAWRPERAAGVLPVVAVLAACLTVTGVVDVAAVRTPAVTETHHLLHLLGLGLVWLLADPAGRFRHAVSG